MSKFITIELPEQLEKQLTAQARELNISLENLILQTLAQGGEETIKKTIQTSPSKRVLGLHKGQIWISDDFNEPLPDEFWGFDV